jgi:hypothetical protein
VIRKLTLVAGFGAGYVLGAKAGTQRYDQIMSKFRELAGMPAVQDVTSTIADTAGQIGDKAKATVTEKVAAVGDKVTGNDVVDLGTTGSKSRTGARTAAAPMPGAAASATAPDA